MKQFFVTYAWAIGWTITLICFSYGELIRDCILSTNNIEFETKLVAMHSNDANVMLLVNLGLVLMLFVDNIIIYSLFKKNNS